MKVPKIPKNLPLTFPSRATRGLVGDKLTLVPYKGEYFKWPNRSFEPRICRFCGTVGAVVNTEHPACEMCGAYQEERMTPSKKKKLRAYVTKFVSLDPELKPRQWSTGGDIIE
jgi:hypothetical protein